MPAAREATTAADRVSNAILERQASVFDLIRANTDRNHRFTRSLIESYRQGNREWLEVSRRWVKNPTDVTGIYEAVSDAIGNAQQRTIALALKLAQARLLQSLHGQPPIGVGTGAESCR